MAARALRSTLLLLAACSARGAAPTPTPTPTPPSNTAADAPPPAPFTCGAATCGADEVCEDRFKGHDTDDEGRPLERKKCVPMPAACRAEPTCACVGAQLSSTHCTDDGGQVRIDDYPR